MMMMKKMMLTIRMMQAASLTTPNSQPSSQRNIIIIIIIDQIYPLFIFLIVCMFACLCMHVSGSMCVCVARHANHSHCVGAEKNSCAPALKKCHIWGAPPRSNIVRSNACSSTPLDSRWTDNVVMWEVLRNGWPNWALSFFPSIYFDWLMMMMMHFVKLRWHCDWRCDANAIGWTRVLKRISTE